MLTARQREVLEFIDRSIRQSGGISPTHAEIAAALGMSSVGHLHSIVKRLVDRGFLRHLPRRARSFEVLRRPSQPRRQPWLTRIFIFDDATKALVPWPGNNSAPEVRAPRPT